jgi:ethanolamine permease
MPKGLILGMLTLMVSALLITFLNSSVGSVEEGKMHGAFSLSTSGEPLLDGFRVLYGSGAAKTLAFLAVIGLIASFHTIIYAYGRNIYSLGRAGYFPMWLSITHPTRKTPHVALIVGAVLGYVVALVMEYGKSLFGNVPVGAVLLNMAVFGAVIAYIMQMVAFIRLRQILPNIERPYVSPLGIAGAATAAVIAAITLGYLLLDEAVRVGVWGCAAWFLAGLVYFALVGRHRLVYSPEEEFALTGGTSGAP